MNELTNIKTSVNVTIDNVDMLDMSHFFVDMLKSCKLNYNIVVDSAEENTRSCRDDYIHFYQYTTKQAQNKAHDNVFQCYLKSRDREVCILCNKTLFDAFNTDIEHVKQYKSTSLIRYRVAYADFIAFMCDISAYDNMRTSSTTVTKDVAQNVK